MKFTKQFTSGISMILCLVAFMGDIQNLSSTSTTVNAEITNTSKVQNIRVQKGKYVQVRVAGFGYGDESLDSDISQVEMTVTFESDKSTQTNILSNSNFDLMVFENDEDYLCYVESVHLHYHENEVQSCDFLSGDKYFPQVSSKTIQNRKFLNKRVRTNQYIWVIDNTDWAEAVQDPNFEPRSSVGDDTITVKVTMEMKFTSNDKFEAWSFMFTIIFLSLGGLALVSFLFFLRMTCVYQNFSMERRQLKRKIMEIQETEYSAFLFEQKKVIQDKNPSIAAGAPTTGYGSMADQSIDDGDFPGTSIQ